MDNWNTRVGVISVGTVVIASVNKVLYCCAPEHKPLRIKRSGFVFGCECEAQQYVTGHYEYARL
jgi:hypothetical protein